MNHIHLILPISLISIEKISEDSYTKRKYYEIINIDKYGIYIRNNDNSVKKFDQSTWYVKDYFYTSNQLRRYKLDKLKIVCYERF